MAHTRNIIIIVKNTKILQIKYVSSPYMLIILGLVCRAMFTWEGDVNYYGVFIARIPCLSEERNAYIERNFYR